MAADCSGDRWNKVHMNTSNVKQNCQLISKVSSKEPTNLSQTQIWIYFSFLFHKSVSSKFFSPLYFSYFKDNLNELIFEDLSLHIS